VLNKADALTDSAAATRLRHPDGVLVSAATGEGLDELRDRVEAEFERTLKPMELLLPYAEGGRLAELHDLAATSSARTRRRASASARASPPASPPASRRSRRRTAPAA
jgi:50S ribosomal subunit-associated GTPase HflX